MRSVRLGEGGEDYGINCAAKALPGRLTKGIIWVQPVFKKIDMPRRISIIVSVLPLCCVLAVQGQQRIDPVAQEVIRGDEKLVQEDEASTRRALVDRSAEAPLYRLGPDDLVLVRVLDLEEIPNEPVRVDRAGYIRLPVAGRVLAEGRTVEELADAIQPLLKDYLLDPQVTVSVAEFRARPVSVLGAVNDPGVIQLQGPKTLWEILSEAGGLRQDAGEILRLTRRLDQGPIPHSDARVDRINGISTVDFNLRDVVEMRSPDTNLELKSNDVVAVLEADVVYVVGRVQRGGGFVINGSISLLEALALAGGTGDFAKAGKAAVLRVQAGTDERQVIPVDLKALLRGKGEDVTLRPKDILFVPHAGWKEFGQGLAQAGIAAATSSLIYWGIRGDTRR